MDECTPEWVGQLHKRFDTQDEVLCEVRTILTGGKDPSRGIVVQHALHANRIDSLESTNRKMLSYVGAAIVSGVTGLGAWIWSKVTQGPHT